MALSQSLSTAPNFSVDQGLEYYAGKTELLDWINHLLELQLTRLEQLTSGAVYCQILDAFWADCVAIRKVNFFAREDYEILPNYKLLQAAFTARGVTKELDVRELSCASCSDLMEFAQWLYKTFKGVPTLPGYNPNARRALSVKGGTINVPLPACLANNTFEFSRIDLRTSGHHGFAGTPQEQSRSARRLHRAATSPTNGRSGRKTPDYSRVASRYRDGLVAPPDHQNRQSPKLSPRGGAVKRILVSHVGSQTDFVDEEWRPMTVADVGTEVVPVPVGRRDYAVQYTEPLANYDRFSPTGSIVSPSASAPISPGLGSELFSFGPSRINMPDDGSGALGSPKSPSSRRGTLSPTGSNHMEEEDSDSLFVTPRSPRGVGGRRRGPGMESVGEDDGEQLADDQPEGEGGRDVGSGTSSPRDEQLRRRSADAREEGTFGDEAGGGSPGSGRRAQASVSVFAKATLAASFALVGGAQELADLVARSPSPSELKESGEAEENSVGEVEQNGEVGQNGEVSTLDSPGASPQAGSSARALVQPGSGRSPGGDLADGFPTPRDRVASPAGTSSTTMGSAAASPSPPAGQHRWRNSPTVPPDVAALLASPAVRTRLASSACIRDMSNALDICTTALFTIDKSLVSYDTLLAGGAAEAATAAAQLPVGVPSLFVCSPALCGKARTLQDALQTLLEHSLLLLSDVQAYSQATHSLEQQQQQQQLPRSPSTSPHSRLARSTSPVRGFHFTRGSPPESPQGGGVPASVPTRDFWAEAGALLESAQLYESRLQALRKRAEEVLQLTPPSPRPADISTSPSFPPSDASAPHRHLTEEQRKLCSTSQLDSHLKAVGMAQFALVQDNHRELAALTATYFRHGVGTGGGDAASPGVGGGGEPSTGGGSTGSSRKARVFKLGEYQLKQLRNGDIYKGRYVCNKKNGEGVYHFINADVYEGEFRDDRMDGHGIYTFSHEGRYEGQWRNAVYNGTGAETFAKGSTYHGEYAGGLRNGWGVCRFYNGDYYEGQWAKGLRDGCGMQQCTDDSNFVGEYQRGKRHGHGVYSFPNGDRYEGQYFEDLPHGHGTYHFASGQCYEGQWQQGKKHGWSVYTVDNGSRFMGLWSEGKPTWVQQLNGDAPASTSEDNNRSLQQALQARDMAVQAAGNARGRAASHWDVAGHIQIRLQEALRQAQESASLAQQARRKACDLAARLDAAVALLRTQGAGAPMVTATP